MPAVYSSLQTSSSVCRMGIFPLNTKFKGPAPQGDGSADIIDDALTLFRANIFFKQYDVKNSTDRTIIYLTLFITECIKAVQKCNSKSDIIKELTSLGISKFDIPGDANFPLNPYYSKPANTGEAEQCRALMLQMRQETCSRMIEKLTDPETGKPSKWWMCFSKRKFLDKSLAAMGQ